MDANVDAQNKRLPGGFQTNLKGETVWRSVPLTVEAWAAHILDYATANKDKFVLVVENTGVALRQLQ